VAFCFFNSALLSGFVSQKATCDGVAVPPVLSGGGLEWIDELPFLPHEHALIISTTNPIYNRPILVFIFQDFFGIGLRAISGGKVAIILLYLPRQHFGKIMN
jgi:hypothetical protein